MSALFDDDGPAGASNLPEVTVSELSASVKRAIESGFARVRVRGEIGRVSRPRSGHVYFDLKDERASLSAVCWKGQAARLAVPPTEGDEVVATGRLTTFPGQSRYQIVVEELELAGQGALLAKLERLKQALAAEGLFAAERKRPIPYLPETIGVITSPSGAVIRDILHRLSDRFPRRVLLWPVAVQGEKCAPEVANAIRGFSDLPPGHPCRPDVVIVARGGGSIEDLWGFNDEAVVRAAADSSIPLISAVGHETDTTLIDFAADLRAPTPTAAAEHAVPVRADLLADLAALDARRRRAAARALDARRDALRALARALPRPEAMVQERAQRLDALADRLPRALAAFATSKRAALAQGPAGRFSPALVTAPIRERRARLTDRAGRLAPALARAARDARGRLAQLSARLRPARAAAETRARAEALTRLSRRFDRAATAAVAAERTRLSRAARLLETLSHKATLARGFAVIHAEGGLAQRLAQLPPGAAFEVEFADGRRGAVAAGEAPRPARRAAPKPKTGSDDDPQGSLL